jgi:hypothetical protein
LVALEPAAANVEKPVVELDFTPVALPEADVLVVTLPACFARPRTVALPEVDALAVTVLECFARPRAVALAEADALVVPELDWRFA